MLSKKSLESLLKSKSFTGTIVMSAGVFLTSVINYLLQLVLGRMLTIESFGIFNSLLSLTYVLSISSNAFIMALIKQINKTKSEEEISAMYWDLSKVFFFWGAVLVVALLLVQNLIASYLHLPSSSMLIPFAFFVGLTFLNVPPRAYLQGLLNYFGFAAYLVIHATIRLILPVFFVYIGFTVGGVYWGFALAHLLAFYIGYLLLRSSFVPTKISYDFSRYKQVLFFSVPVVIITTAMSALVSLDVVLVKHFFDETTTGIYASVVTIGKVLLFGTSVLSATMYPIISAAYHKGTGFVQKFALIFGAQTTVIGIGLLIFYVFPDLITTLMFGERYSPAIPFVSNFALFIGLYSLLNFLVTFCVAIDKTSILYVAVAAVLVQIGVIYEFHSSLEQIIHNNTLIVTGTLLLTCIYIFWEFLNSRKNIIAKNDVAFSLEPDLQ